MARACRSSLTSPLRIDTLQVGLGGGVLGMTLCPGRKGPSDQGSPWNRDLAQDLQAIAEWHALALISVMPERELRALGVPQLGQAAAEASLCWFCLPIAEGAPPDRHFEKAWKLIGPSICSALDHGGRMVIHCRGGLGRTGLVASLALIELGMEAFDAVMRVREARAGAVETAAQEQYILNYRRQF